MIPEKEPPPNNYRPITCLPMMWKIRTVQIREEIYYSLTNCALFAEEIKDTAKNPQAPVSYFTLISTSSTRARRNGKI